MRKLNKLIYSLEMAEEFCTREDGLHLLSINSHEEQQLVQRYLYKLLPYYHIDTIYRFIGLRKVHNHVSTFLKSLHINSSIIQFHNT